MKSDMIFIIFMFVMSTLAFNVPYVIETLAGIGTFSIWWFLYNESWRKLI